MARKKTGSGGAMTLKELLVKVGVDLDAQSFAKGQLAVEGVKWALGELKNAASNALAGLFDGLIGFNARAEDAKLGLAGIAAVNLKIPLDEAADAADRLYAKLQDDAAQTTASTEELVDFAGQIANPIFTAGKSMEQLGEFTTKAVIAAKMLGLQGTAGLDLEQAIQGRAGSRDRFAKFLIESVGKTSLDKFNAMGGAGAKGMKTRADQLEKWLQDPGLQAVIEKQANTWSGIINGIKDNAAKILGGIGKPIFEMLKGPLKTFGDWLVKNGPKIVSVFVAIGRWFVAIYRVSRAVVSTLIWVAKGFWNLVNVLGPVATAFGAMLLAVGLYGAASVAAALSSAAAWVVATAPVLLMAALLAAVILVIEDIWVGLNGGQSLIFELVDAWGGFVGKWLEDHGLGWLGDALKEVWAWLTDFDNQVDILLQAFKEGFRAFADWIVGLFKSAWATIKEGAQEVADFFNPFAPSELEKAANRALAASYSVKGTGPRNITLTTKVDNLTVQTTGDPSDVANKTRQVLDEHTATQHRAALEYFGGSR